ncbi:MAG: FtsX-like permease family protein, partial [Proteobacteria bacterium]|nr:FtsX-like permease family protein [Pseudomonadota bacterium]
KGHADSFVSRVDTVIIGGAIAEELSYDLGQRLTISHGLEKISLEEHTNVLFEVTGILKKTGTALDRSLHISLEGLEAVHAGWSNLEPVSASDSGQQPVTQSLADIKPKQVSNLLVIVKSKMKIFELQSQIGKIPGYRAILPGIALMDFWQIIQVAETILLLISFLVILCTLVGMICSMLASLINRSQEISVLRSLGASPWFVAQLLLLESIIMLVMALLVAWCLSTLSLYMMSSFLSEEWGIYLKLADLVTLHPKLVAVTLVLGLIAGIIPACLAYRKSLSESLSSL